MSRNYKPHSKLDNSDTPLACHGGYNFLSTQIGSRREKGSGREQTQTKVLFGTLIVNPIEW